jgi:ATP adenylyltransferase
MTIKMAKKESQSKHQDASNARLWAPWRMKYIQEAACGQQCGCIFCDKSEPENDESDLILFRGRTCFVMMNLYPYNNGHLLIAPFRHVGLFEELTDEEMLEAGKLTQRCLAALKETMNPHGYNVGMNLGRTAGAGVEDHLHLHIVPRWSGDTNFMPVIAETKVISESLQEGWKRLAQALRKKAKGKGKKG